MKYRILGKSGLRVSVVGVGTWQFGGEWGREYSPAEAADILAAAREGGINLIDTAECYGDHWSEVCVGKAIAHERDKWVVATKFGHQYHGFQDRTRHFLPQEVKAQVEASRKALQTDYIDLYQFHSPFNEEFANPALWDLLQELVQKGVVRHIGLSISPNSNTRQVADAPRAGVESVQVVYNRLDQKPEEEVFGLCRHHHLGVLARVPLASGLLSGKYRAGHRFGKNDVRAERDQAKMDARIRETEEIAAREKPPGVGMATWALAWCLQHPAVTCVIPGCKNVTQVHQNAAAADLDLVSPDHPQAATA